MRPRDASTGAGTGSSVMRRPRAVAGHFEGDSMFEVAREAKRQKQREVGVVADVGRVDDPPRHV